MVKTTVASKITQRPTQPPIVYMNSMVYNMRQIYHGGYIDKFPNTCTVYVFSHLHE